jgi:hypothetical protein
MKIALCMIVSDDFTGLVDALDSADGLYDYLSICVVDHSGIDVDLRRKIYELADVMEAYIDTYLPYWDKPFIDDFSAARNASIVNVPKDTDWIFILDTDDRVVDPMAARSAIISQEPNVVIMGRVQSLKNNHSFMQWRAWPKGCGHFEGRIHNQFKVERDMDAKFVSQVHITYHDRAFGDRYERNMAILTDITDKKPEHHYYMGEMLFLKAKRDKVIETEGEDIISYFHKALDDGVEDSLGYRCHYHLADYYAIMAAKDRDNAVGNKATEHILKMLEVSVYPREPLYLMGRLLASMSKHANAVVWLQAAVDMPDHFTVWHLAKDVRAPSYEQMALSYLSMGDHKRAVHNHAIARLMSKTFESTDHHFEGLITK